MMTDYEKYILLKNRGLVSLSKNPTMPGFILTFNRFDPETGDLTGKAFYIRSMRDYADWITRENRWTGR